MRAIRIALSSQSPPFFNNVSDIELEKSFSREKDIQKYLQKTSTDYRVLEPGRLLYEMMMKTSSKDRFSDDYVKLVYVTLKAWNMDSRGAKLCKYEEFFESIQKNKTTLKKLQSKEIQNFDEIDQRLFEGLFDNLSLTQKKSKLVTFSLYIQ